MAEQEMTEQGRAAVQLVREWLSRGEVPPPDWEWTVHPFRDALLVCPVTRARGSAIYLVRQGAIRPVYSNRRKTEEDVYEELVTEQG